MSQGTNFLDSTLTDYFCLGSESSVHILLSLQVLKIWNDRKIMPESILRRCMDDIEAKNHDITSGIFLRRPSRTERSIDDPIREMEGLLVDEYGRYTFLLR